MIDAFKAEDRRRLFTIRKQRKSMMVPCAPKARQVKGPNRNASARKAHELHNCRNHKHNRGSNDGGFPARFRRERYAHSFEDAHQTPRGTHRNPKLSSTSHRSSYTSQVELSRPLRLHIKQLQLTHMKRQSMIS
ncbi:hypothetical protein KC19_4G067900 [Ceratodon purpureus]|uniref:Uncharacterized protein n=1 Tax=Ceratodon purpureus TaxID=3225 RepID=A0A8T0I6G0_CERPU|nr:hypothetical protein KC19_4G067900 [Ceratodon purpureus]